MKAARKVPWVLRAAVSFRVPVEGGPAGAGPKQNENRERQSDSAGAGDDDQPAATEQPSSRGSAMDTGGAAQPRQAEARRLTFGDERDMKRRLTTKAAAAARLAEQADMHNLDRLSRGVLSSMTSET